MLNAGFGEGIGRDAVDGAREDDIRLRIAWKTCERILQCPKQVLLTLLVGCDDEFVNGAVQGLVRERLELLGLAVVVHLFRGVHAVRLADEDTCSRLE